MEESNAKEEDLGMHFLELFRRKPKEDDDEEKEELPSELNTVNILGGFAVATKDKLSVKYRGISFHSHDVGVIQGNKPAPMKRPVYYFEMFVTNAGVKGQISIGFTPENFMMRRHPGWDVNSCGYHGNDGFIYLGLGKGEDLGETYTTGDVVGAGINYAAQEFFFTKNGIIMCTVSKYMNVPLFPTVAVHSYAEEVCVNFGQNPFVFDVSGYEARERMEQEVRVEENEIPLLIKASYGIVRSYLRHYGYGDTLVSFDFDLASSSIVPPIYGIDDEQERRYALNHRKTLRQLIRDGEIDVAFGKLREWYPEIAEDNTSAMCFLLHCQKFIELVRVGALEEAVEYGRMELSGFFGVPVFKDLAQECVALLSYKQPLESVVGYLLKDSRREIVADTVNAMILSTNPNMKETKNCLHSNLEWLLTQLTACCLEIRELTGNQRETFQLQRVLSRV